MRLKSIAALLSLTMLLPGCAALSALKGEPDRDVFELQPPPAQPRSCGRKNVAQLVVELPKTRGTLDTDRIMIRPNPLQTQYLPDARWGDTVPVTLQTMLVRGFGAYDAFSHVGRAPLGASGDYAVLSEINDFNAEVSGSGAVVRLSVDAQIVREMDARVVSRRLFTVNAESPSTNTGDLIAAFDVADRQLVAQMTEWGLGAVGVRASSCR